MAQDEFGAEVFCGQSSAVSRLQLQVARFAPHFRTVLLVGEPGTGKRTVAAEMHRLSPAGGQPMIQYEACELVQNAPAAEQTLYLPGLELVRLSAQEELLACLKTVARDSRVVVGCAGDPRGLVAAGRLRPELLERLGTLEIRIPALRNRLDDLPAIAAAMLHRLGTAHSLLPDQSHALKARPWTRNLAELWEVCTAFAEGGRLPHEDSAETPAETPLRLEDVMRHHVRTVIQRCAGNKLKAAELLGISRSTLYRMLEAAAGHPDL